MTSPDPYQTDEVLLSRLRLVVDQVDPVPAHLADGAKALLGLRRLDEELAELVRDSAEERDRLLAVRGEGDVRLISFETGPVTVELQVTERGAVRDLVAEVSGTALASAEVETPGRRHPTVRDDSMISADAVPSGLLRLHLRTIEGHDLVTSWVRV